MTLSTRIWKKIDTDGNTAYVGDPSDAIVAIANGYEDGRIIEFYDAESRLFEFTYDGSGPLLSVEVKIGGVATGYKVEYTYYDGTDAYGSAGDLQTVLVQCLAQAAPACPAIGVGLVEDRNASSIDGDEVSDQSLHLLVV